MAPKQAMGSKLQVWNGTAAKTSGGLTKDKLMKNKHGKVVSKKKHAAGVKAAKNLPQSGQKGRGAIGSAVGGALGGFLPF